MAYRWLENFGSYNFPTLASDITPEYLMQPTVGGFLIAKLLSWGNTPVSISNIHQDTDLTWDLSRDLAITYHITTSSFHYTVSEAGSVSTYGYGSWGGFSHIDTIFGVDYDNEKAVNARLYVSPDFSDTVFVNVLPTTEAQKSALYQVLMNALPPEYVWTAWDQIAGNGGQYRANLTKIKADSIGDISGANYGTADDMSRVSSACDVVPYVRNMNYNSPVKIAYSGVNWMTAEIQPDAALLTNQVKCVFNFYIKNVSGTTPFYSLTEYFFAGADDHHYLSFVHDDEQQAAAFLPVGFSRSTPQTPYYWGNVSPDTNEMNLLWLWLQASGTPTPDPRPSSPYDNGTTDNGGQGGNPIPQDDIHTPNVPVLGAMASGMFTVYCPTDTQLGQIAQYLWSDNFIDNVKKYFNNVSDNIIAFYVLPLAPDNLPTKNFKIGNLENTSITDVKYLSSRFVSVDMGAVTVESRWDTYLDFSPFTRFNCYLPGVGIVALDSDDIMSPANQDGSLPALTGSTISLTYVIDLFTGVLVAYVKINGQIRYQFPGRMGYSIPLTGQNYTAMGQGFVTAMAGLASTIATGGTAAPFTAGATAAGIVNAMKPDVYRGGNLSGDASMLSLKTPILIRTRPNKPAIENQELFSGAPSYKIDTIGSFSGFTQVAEAHIEGISCTDAERNEIMQLLRNGVLI